jgi:ribose transport system ATP-binding protein
MSARVDPTATKTETAKTALHVRHVSKLFEGQQALDDAELEVRQGEIHALLGQNGSGKSTLIKVLAGYHKPEHGAEAELYGRPLALHGVPPTPEEPIRFVHQDLGLIGDLNAVDNLAVTSGYRGQLWLSERRERAAAREYLERYGLDIDLDAPVAQLSMATQAMIAIVRAIKDVPSEKLLLVVDEATASLPTEEAATVFDLLRDVRDRGGAVVYVTHRLGEVFEIADRVTVLRDGRNVATEVVSGLEHDDLVELIIGRQVEEYYPADASARAEVALVVRNLSGPGVEDVSLTVHRGEIVGVTGLVGSGAEALLPLIFGATRRTAGEVSVAGISLRGDGPAESIAQGLAFAHADRKRFSAIPDWTVAENVTLPAIQDRGGRLPWLSERRERRDVLPWIERLGIEPAQPAAPLSSLSGGNQQRVVIARWLRCGFQVLMIEDPTAGVDVGGKPPIYEALSEAAGAGAGVLMSTSDAEEAAAVCDRVLVLVEGRIAASLENEQRSVERILGTAMGVGA